MTTNFTELRNGLKSLTTREQREAYLSSLEPDLQAYCFTLPDLFLFDKQIVPETTDWRYCLLQCGRGWGKSFAGAAWLAKKIRKGAKLVALCAPTYFDVQEIQMPALLSWFLPSEIVGYSSKDHVITFKNGARCLCLSSEKDNVGTNLEYLWCDEIGNWCDQISDKIDLRFYNIDNGVRAGKHPQIIITSTPKSQKFFWDFQEQVDKGSKFHMIIRGTLFDNPFLPQSFIQAQLDKIKGYPNRAKQEIYGELITENPEAMFKSEWINDNRFTNPTNVNKNNNLDLTFFWQEVLKQNISIKQIIISCDPSGSNKKTSDETGIIVIAQTFSNEAYVIYDLSDRHSPDEWAKIVRNLYYTYSKSFTTKIIVETNYGGDIVIANITALDHSLSPHIISITASKSKLIRAETAASKYQRKKIHHIGYHEKLERQMCNYTGPNSNYSPDRMDALVHALNALYVAEQTNTKRNLSFLKGF